MIVYYLKNRQSKCVTVASVTTNKPPEIHAVNPTGSYLLPPAYQDPKLLYPTQYPNSQSSPYIPITEGFAFPVTEGKK